MGRKMHEFYGALKQMEKDKVPEKRRKYSQTVTSSNKIILQNWLFNRFFSTLYGQTCMYLMLAFSLFPQITFTLIVVWSINFMLIKSKRSMQVYYFYCSSSQEPNILDAKI